MDNLSIGYSDQRDTDRARDYLTPVPAIFQGIKSPAVGRMRDLMDESEAVVAAERSRIASEGWGARLLAQEYLLQRRLFRSLSTGKVIDRNWTRFSFPPTYHYDVLRGLDYLLSAGVKPDGRIDEAVDLVAKKQHQNGRWPLENLHPDRVPFDMEGGAGTSSRWNTLRALRVLDWYSARD